MYLQDVIREGLGRRVPPAGRDKHSVLDRDTPPRAAAVAGQGADTDGGTHRPYLIRLVSLAEQRIHTASPTPSLTQTVPH